MRIGLTQRVLFHKNRAYDSLDHSWYEFLQGHTLVSIPNRFPIEQTGLDALIITGGENHFIRNRVEHALADDMMSHGLPVIGVCHGCQLLTEKLGGQIDYIDAHMDSHHVVTYNDQQYLVNSYHNVRVETLPPGATALAYDPDGNVEAWIHGNTASVMWHPERMIDPWIPSEIQKLLS